MMHNNIVITVINNTVINVILSIWLCQNVEEFQGLFRTYLNDGVFKRK